MALGKKRGPKQDERFIAAAQIVTGPGSGQALKQAAVGVPGEELLDRTAVGALSRLSAQGRDDGATRQVHLVFCLAVPSWHHRSSMCALVPTIPLQKERRPFLLLF